MKKISILILISMLILGCLAGCSQNTSSDDKKTVTLTMWHNYGGDMQETMDLLIDEFNSTVGKEQDIVIDVTAISSSAELNKSLEMIANGDPGAPDMPDIFTGYPKVAIQFQKNEMIVDFDDYFTGEDLDAYVKAFLEEGRLSDGGLYVFPLAKSTEVLYVNQTLFDRFSEETGARSGQLSTFEGIAELSEMYYKWTDGKTPDTPNDGKQFYAADSWFNFAEMGMAQLNDSIFDGESVSLEGNTYRHIFDTVYTPAVKGGIAIYDGYSSDLSKTGDLLCSTGSSAGILFYGDTITYADGTVENVEYSILPYPTFQGGEKIALQRGGGLMVAKSDERKEAAACEFVKWLTAPEQNMTFIEKTGYLPVTKQAFEEDMPVQLETLDDARIKKMLTAVLSMYENYKFFIAPNYAAFDEDSETYENDFKMLLTQQREQYLAGETVSSEGALSELKQ